MKNNVHKKTTKQMIIIISPNEISSERFGKLLRNVKEIKKTRTIVIMLLIRKNSILFTPLIILYVYKSKNSKKTILLVVVFIIKY